MNTKRRQNKARLDALRYGRTSLKLMLFPEIRTRKPYLAWNHPLKGVIDEKHSL